MTTPGSRIPNPDSRPLPRKGARTMASIPPEILAALNSGAEEPLTLPEWLAIDQRQLLAAVAKSLRLRDAARLDAAAEAVAGLGVQQRTKGIGRALLAVFGEELPRHAGLCGHPSAMVRSWVGYGIGAMEGLDFATRLALLKPFAADANMSVRECAWDAWRPQFAEDPAGHLPVLLPWVADADANVRRCACEGTRPRGVWTLHIPLLKRSPEIALPLLEPLRADPSRYVQDAVANWLNDASKSAPEWTRGLCARWESESPGKATAYIVRRALRTLDGGKAKVQKMSKGGKEV